MLTKAMQGILPQLHMSGAFWKPLVLNLFAVDFHGIFIFKTSMAASNQVLMS